MKSAVCIISGGMDSAICARLAKDMGYEIIGLHFDYGQRTMDKERECFNNICDYLGVAQRYCLDLGFIKAIGHNALTDINIDISPCVFDCFFNDPRGSRKAANKAAKEDSKKDSNKDSKSADSSLRANIPNTYAPFRNGIFLSIAGAIAETHRCEAIFIGVIQEDNSGYPDCSSAFISKAESFINEGRAPDARLKIHAPLLFLNKGEIVKLGLEKDAPLKLTWSCYKNSDIACGICDSCVMRLRGFKDAGVRDFIPYAINVD